jgi:acetyl-CoA synthetase (ADP-forming)
MDIIEQAAKESRTALSEYEAKLVLASYGIPITSEILVSERDDLTAAIDRIGLPVVLKGCSPAVSHKTEKSLVRLDIRTLDEARAAFDEIKTAMNDGAAAVLVQEMIKGQRELMVGLTRDPQFGPCVMFGLGGIFTEILKDVSFRLAPLDERDALEMMADIKGHRILDGIRGMEPVDRAEMARILMNVGRIGVEQDRIKEIDINPLIVRGGHPVAADALIVLEEPRT